MQIRELAENAGAEGRFKSKQSGIAEVFDIGGE
jgi:hypothetical protein